MVYWVLLWLLSGLDVVGSWWLQHGSRVVSHGKGLALGGLNAVKKWHRQPECIFSEILYLSQDISHTCQV